MTTPDAIVIGAGVIGAATTLELQRAGFRTLCLDRNPAAGYGSTSSSCAVIRTFYSTLEGCAFAQEGYHYWKRWGEYLGVADERGLVRFHETGCLVMKTKANDFLRPMLDRVGKAGIPFEEWSAADIARRLPFLDLRLYAPPRRPDEEGFGEPTGGKIAGAVYFPEAGYVSDPQLATHNLQRAAEAAGARFRFNAEVTSIAKDAGGRIAGVELAGGERIAAAIVVNVAGPRSAKVNALAGALADMKIATRALKREVAHVPAPVPGYETSGIVVSDSDIGCYSRPETGNKILIGSEDPACDVRQWVDYDTYDRSFTEQVRNQVLRAAQRIPSLPIPNAIQGVVDCYDVSDDWMPIYDRSCVPGFYMAIGTSGNQFKNAALSGAVMAKLIAACESGRDHDRAPVMYTGRYTGRAFDLSFFSRLRDVNRASSFSVLG
ncbi:MAG: FAD-dependent oxidoreductase [Hyphomicrobiales bacterium]